MDFLKWAFSSLYKIRLIKIFITAFHHGKPYLFDRSAYSTKTINVGMCAGQKFAMPDDPLQTVMFQMEWVVAHRFHCR